MNPQPSPSSSPAANSSYGSRFCFVVIRVCAVRGDKGSTEDFIPKMETILKAGRNLSNGVCRVAGALARGTRRVLSAVPLLGIAAPGGEEAESATATAGSPADEKSTASSPSADEQVAASAAPAAASTTEPKKEEVAAVSPATASPAEEKKEEPTPSAPTPVPSAEDKKEEAIEKVEATEKKVVEVSPAGGRSIADPIEVPVFRVQPVATSSIIERKTSEDLPSLPPSSPPPTPIDPSPLQQARQAAASATALAEALKLPAVIAVGEEELTMSSSSALSCENITSQKNRAESPIPASILPAPSASSSSPMEITFVPAKVEHTPVVVKTPVETVVETRDVAREGETLMITCDDEERVEISPRVENTPVSSVVAKEISKHQKGEMNAAEEIITQYDIPKQRDQLDVESTQSKSECCLVSKEINLSAVSSGMENISTNDNLPTIESESKSSEFGPSHQLSMDYNNEKNEVEAPATQIMREMKDVATDEVINETSPVVECPIESEINSHANTMKTNVPPNTGLNEKVDAKALSSVEYEKDKFFPAQKQSSFEVCMAEDVEKSTKYISVNTEKVCEIMQMAETERITKPLEQTETSPKKFDTAEKHSLEDVERIVEAIPVSLSHAYSAEHEISTESRQDHLSDDVLVKAKRAVVIPEDDGEEELSNTTDSDKAIPEVNEEKVEDEPESDTALPTEETLISEELEDVSAPEDVLTVESCELLSDAKAVHFEDEPLPPPMSEDTATCGSQMLEPPSTETHLNNVAKDEPVVVFSTTIEAESVSVSPLQIEQIEEIESQPVHKAPSDSPVASESILSEPLGFPKTLTDFLSAEVGENQPNEPQTLPPFDSEPTTSDYPSMTSDDTTNLLPLRVSPLPYPTEFPSVKFMFDFDNSAPSPKDPTETLLTPPVTPHSQSNVNIATTNDCPQTLSNDEDDRDNREPQSKPDLYDLSDVESDRLAAECPTKTECQEGALSCQLLTAVQPTAAQEHHQSAPEVEAPVENNLAHESSTTESINEAPKVAPPAVPTEAPASPPTAPAITEDVASVTKAIEEIDISDKAVAAAVNEAIECNTNEIIADAHHQNNINEYE